MLIVRTFAGFPPEPATIECRTARSLGSPVTPTVRPWSSRGVRTDGAVITEASGRSTIGSTPTIGMPLARAIARSWMSRIAKFTRPSSSSEIASVEAPGTSTCRRIPCAVSRWR